MGRREGGGGGRGLETTHHKKYNRDHKHSNVRAIRNRQCVQCRSLAGKVNVLNTALQCAAGRDRTYYAPSWAC